MTARHLHDWPAPAFAMRRQHERVRASKQTRVSASGLQDIAPGVMTSGALALPKPGKHSIATHAPIHTPIHTPNARTIGGAKYMCSAAQALHRPANAPSADTLGTRYACEETVFTWQPKKYFDHCASLPLPYCASLPTQQSGTERTHSRCSRSRKEVRASNTRTRIARACRAC